MNIEALARPEILAMKPYQSARRTAGADGILLNANEAPAALLEDEQWAALSLNRYPQPQPAALTDRLAGLYGVDAKQLLVTRGSDEGIDLLTRVFCRPGQDAIVECPPCFGMYRIAADIQGAPVIAVPRMEQDRLRIDFDFLCETISSNSAVRLVFLTSPNNPSGDVIEPGNIERVLKACGDHALLVLDEAYIEFCNEESAVRRLSAYPALVILRTLSKAWGAAGLRCGAVLADPRIISLLQRVMAPYPLTAPAIAAALAVTSGRAKNAQADMLNTIAEGKAQLLGQLEAKAWVTDIWPGEANFVLTRVDKARALVAFCASRGIRIRDFSSQPMLDNCVRLTIGSASEMAALEEVLNDYGAPS
jgi:histidinol-phosphate aminotransferase